MSNPEEKIVKIVDSVIHSRGASVIQSGAYGAVVTASAIMAPTDSFAGNSSYELSSANDTVASTTYVTKTMGTTQYRRELTYNSEGDLLGVSSWEEI